MAHDADAHRQKYKAGPQASNDQGGVDGAQEQGKSE